MVDWKSCDELTTEDFERHALWGYDLARAEADEASDETWVRPYAFDAEPPESDLLFARARLRTSGGDVVPGAVLFVFERGRPRVAGVAVLQPSYFAVGLAEGKAAPEDREELEGVLPEALPLAYEAEVPLGGRALRLSGVVR